MQVRQVRAKSKDGTEVPITLIHRPDVALDGSNRTLLYGYGGYGISQWPIYSGFVAAWVRLGGVYAVATIRGGGELGSAWHEGGRLSKQQNSFDDFAAAAEWLIANGVTRRERLGIFGASNGGRLVLTTMLQRRDLIGAVVSGVPVADMVRFPSSPSASPGRRIRRSEQARRLQVADGVLAAAQRQAGTELSAADDPDRGQRPARGPAHAYKMAATLRAISPATEVYVRTRVVLATAGGTPSASPSSTRPTSSASSAPSLAARSWSCPRSRRDMPCMAAGVGARRGYVGRRRQCDVDLASGRGPLG